MECYNFLTKHCLTASHKFLIFRISFLVQNIFDLPMTSSLTHGLFKSILNSQVSMIFLIYSLLLGHRRCFAFFISFTFIKINFITEDMVYLAICCLWRWEKCVFFCYYWSMSFHQISLWYCLVQFFYIFSVSVYLFSWLLRQKSDSVWL